MKAITLAEAINEELQDSAFAEGYQRELLINEIAKMIVKMRKKSKLTQLELAKKAHTTQPVVARIESGSDKRIPSLALLSRLASAANFRLKLNFAD